MPKGKVVQFTPQRNPIGGRSAVQENLHTPVPTATTEEDRKLLDMLNESLYNGGLITD